MKYKNPEKKLFHSHSLTVTLTSFDFPSGIKHHCVLTIPRWALQRTVRGSPREVQSRVWTKRIKTSLKIQIVTWFHITTGLIQWRLYHLDKKLWRTKRRNQPIPSPFFHFTFLKFFCYSYELICLFFENHKLKYLFILRINEHRKDCEKWVLFLHLFLVIYSFDWPIFVSLCVQSGKFLPFIHLVNRWLLYNVL